MFSAFLVSLREGVEAALVVGICLLYLRKIGRLELQRFVWYAVGAAVVASLGMAAAMQRFAWNQETFEGVFMLLAAVLLVTMILWMRRVARSLRGEIEQRVGHFAGRARFASLGLFLFVFLMVAREGAESVLLLGAVSLDTQGLFLLIGTVLGLGLAVALAVFFFQGALPLRMDRFFEASSVMLMVIVLQLVLTGIHELSEALVIPSGPWMMSVLGPIVRNDVFFFVLLLGTGVWVVWRELLLRRQVLPTGQLSEAEQRRLRWQQQRERRWMSATVVTGLVVLLALTADYVYARNAATLSPATTVEADGEDVRIPLLQVSDGKLHRFSLTHNRTGIRFIVIQRPDGKPAVALDACQICGPHGYYQDGANVICKNCAAAIYIPSIGLPGGCNPVPLVSRVEGDELVIPLSALLGGESFFRR